MKVAGSFSARYFVCRLASKELRLSIYLEVTTRAEVASPYPFRVEHAKGRTHRSAYINAEQPSLFLFSVNLAAQILAADSVQKG